jgi:hypothetical protein
MSYVWLSTNTSLHFVNPVLCNPPAVLVPNVSTYTSNVVAFHTIKDPYGNVALSTFGVLLSNESGQSNWIATTLQVPRAFQNVVITDQTGYSLESTQPPAAYAQIWYASSISVSIPGVTQSQDSLLASTLQISEITLSNLQSKSTIATITSISSLTLHDQYTTTPSSLYISSGSFYIGAQSIKPNVDLNYDIQVIAPGIPWTPAQIPDLHVWFDGKDLSTMYADTSYSRTISTGEEVAVWVDKSINQFSVIKSVAGGDKGLTYIDNVSSLYFLTEAVDPYLETNLTLNISSCTTSFVANPLTNGYLALRLAGDGQPQSRIQSFTPPPQPQSTNYLMAFAALGENAYTFFHQVHAEGAISQPNQVHQFTALLDLYTKSTIIGRENAYNYSYLTFSELESGYDFTGYSTVKYTYFASNYLNVQIGDFIAYNRWLSEPELQKLEGYVMWKYNIQNLLSPFHPYAANPP